MTTRLTVLSAISLTTLLLLIVFLPLPMQAQTSKVIAYYQAYGYGNGQDPWQIDFRNMTHIIHIDGGATDYNPNTAPYWNVKATASDSVHLFWFNGRNMVDSLVNRAHAAGVKVLICLGAGGSSTSFESDSAKNEVMANAVVDFAKRHNYDGVDVDWETDNQTQAFNERLLRMLRRRMDNTWGSYRTRGLICFTPAFDHNTASGGMLIRPMWQGLIDWIQPQAYDLNTPWTQETNGCVYSFDQCVYPPNPATWPSLNKWQPSWDGVRIGVTGNRSAWAGPAYLAAQGWSKSKLVYGFKSYGYGTTGRTTFQGTRNCGDRGSESNLDFMQLALTRGGTRRYDDSSKGLYINGTATSAINAYGFTVGSGQTFIASIEDSVSVKEKTKFVKNNGYGGMMYYDIFWGYDDPAVGGSYIAGQTQPLLYIMSRELNGTSVVSPIMTVAPTSRSFGNVTINTTSSEQTYTASGSNLTPTNGTITITAPTGFRISKTSGSGFASSLTYTCTGGQLVATTVYVRFQPTAAQSYSGNVTHTGGGCSTTNLSVSGIGETFLPVQLASFIGAVKGRTVELAWKTATEVNSNTFEIERRIFAQWEKIGEIPAAGTSSSLHEYTYVDNLTHNGPGNILYRLKTLNNDGSFQYSTEVEVVPAPITFSLEQNYPNPFNPQTKIRYALPENADVQLSVYDVMGREVAELTNEKQLAGYYERTFNSMNLSSGVYFYRVTAQVQGKNTLIQMKKMILIK